MIRKLAAAAALLVTAQGAAHAFCGFYVGGADKKLYNNATQVVLMRDGTRTVLSMQNNYQGPAENFAMVIPVPVVLQKDNVKTLPREVFGHVDDLDAPRLVEYWEQDPCRVLPPEEERAYTAVPAPAGDDTAAKKPDDLGVKIEAKFTVGEYEVLILSAKDSMGLDTWLRQEKYAIPEGAEAVLRPYVEHGMKFFVAKVDVSKVKMVDGMAMLSPLRFHYDSDKFELPVRLGLLNSAGTQDLIVHILARNQRYEVANYRNAFIPTNLAVDEKARDQFAPFYAALFDATLAKHPGAVITEYSWASNSCDPCPTPPLGADDLATLGGDVIQNGGASLEYGGGFVLTRLHARYTKDALGDDLVFSPATAVMGGREVWAQRNQDESMKRDPMKPDLEQGATKSGDNNFQARYIIRHLWAGAIACKDPHRGIWGGPPSGTADDGKTKPAKDLAFAERGGIRLASYVKQDVPEIGLVMGAAAEPEPAKIEKPGMGTGKAKTEGKKGCGCEAAGRSDTAGAALLLLGALMTLRRRKR